MDPVYVLGPGVLRLGVAVQFGRHGDLKSHKDLGCSSSHMCRECQIYLKLFWQALSEKFDSWVLNIGRSERGVVGGVSSLEAEDVEIDS